jgi:putative transposase
MIERDHPHLSIRKQSELLEVNRNRLEPAAPKSTVSDLAVMAELDALHAEFPFPGARKLVRELRDLGHRAGRGRVRRLMRLMGVSALAPQPYTSKPSPENQIYPYLLRDREITRADEVWCADITNIPMSKGHAYLVAIMDWYTRAVLAWEVSNTMDTPFCLRALRRTLVWRCESFAFETFFSDPVGDKVEFLEDAKRQGYQAVVVFIRLDNAETSKQRVAMRVMKGGHDVPDEKLEQRFERMLANLDRAIKLLLLVVVFDNSDLRHPYRLEAMYQDGEL